MINARNYFYKLVKNDRRTYVNISKITNDQGDNYTTGFQLSYPCFKDHYKMIAIDLSKQQTLDADTEAMQQIKITENLKSAGNKIFVFARTMRVF